MFSARKFPTIQMKESIEKLLEAASIKIKNQGFVDFILTIPKFLYNYLFFKYHQSKLSSGICRIDGVFVNLKDQNLSPDVAHNLTQGWYENVEREFVRQYLTPNQDIIELGGGVGYITAIINEQTGSDSTQIVVEANPKLHKSILMMSELNETDAKIEGKAYSSSNETVEMHVQEGAFLTGNVCGSGTPQTEEIETITLREIHEKYRLSEFVLIADIEGAEYELFDTELDLIKQYCKMIIIEFHGDTETIHTYSKRIEQVGFEQVDAADNVVVFEKDVK